MLQSQDMASGAGLRKTAFISRSREIKSRMILECCMCFKDFIFTSRELGDTGGFEAIMLCPDMAVCL